MQNYSFLNRIYVRSSFEFPRSPAQIPSLLLEQFYLDEISYAGTANAIPLHLGPSQDPVAFASLDLAAPARKRPQGYERVSPTEPTSWLSTRTAGTGDGTTYDDWSERDSLAFPFEEVCVVFFFISPSLVLLLTRTCQWSGTIDRAHPLSAARGGTG